MMRGQGAGSEVSRRRTLPFPDGASADKRHEMASPVSRVIFPFAMVAISAMITGRIADESSGARRDFRPMLATPSACCYGRRTPPTRPHAAKRLLPFSLRDITPTHDAH